MNIDLLQRVSRICIAGPGINQDWYTQNLWKEFQAEVERLQHPPRPTIDEYYLGIAQAVSARAECTRRQIGAVIVKDGSIIGTGYNGAPPGEPSCLDSACPRASGKDVVAGVGYAASGCVVIHAEANAIMRAGRERCLGATLYVTDTCCEMCAPLVRAAGIIRVVTPKDFHVLG